MVDVGTGDGLILDMGDVEIVIDGGMNSTPMREYNIGDPNNHIIQWPIELAIVTHADSDHWKGLDALLDTPQARAVSRPILEFWEPGYSRSCSALESYDKFIARIRGLVPAARFHRPLSNTHRPATEGGPIAPLAVPGVPGVRFTLLHSDQDPPNEGGCAFQINDASIVLLIEVGGVRLLLTGDANGKRREQDSNDAPTNVEAKLLALERIRPQTLRASVLKVSHHGSETASTQAFLDAVQPVFAIISASTRHHLPRPGVIRRLEDMDIIVLRTDRTRQPKNDPILCIGNGTGDVECNYADELE
jgi:beta-lactamase superfamily II metal-dependent hydrolase